MKNVNEITFNQNIVHVMGNGDDNNYLANVADCI